MIYQFKVQIISREKSFFTKVNYCSCCHLKSVNLKGNYIQDNHQLLCTEGGRKENATCPYRGCGLPESENSILYYLCPTGVASPVYDRPKKY